MAEFSFSKVAAADGDCRPLSIAFDTLAHIANLSILPPT